MKVIIIGGGIGGLSAAIALGRVGVETAVFEQADRLREVGAGLTLWVNATKALGKLGAAGGLLAIGSAVSRFEVRSWRGDVGFEAWGPGKRFAALPCARGRIFWYGTKNSPEGESILRDDAPALP